LSNKNRECSFLLDLFAEFAFLIWIAEAESNKISLYYPWTAYVIFILFIDAPKLSMLLFESPEKEGTGWLLFEVLPLFFGISRLDPCLKASGSSINFFRTLPE
jgi:hypothetical protein